MIENDMQQAFTDGEGPFVTGAFQGEHPTDSEPESPAHGASMGEYPEIYNEWSSGELYEGPGRSAESEAFEGESPFLNEDEMVRDLAGPAPQGSCGCRCTCCDGKKGRGAARRRPVAPAHEYEDTGSGGRPTLSRGSRGQAVMELQSGLSKLGFNPGPIDGIFGSKTEGAVMGFQQSRGLTGTGVVDANTWAELDKALGGSGSTGGNYGPPPGGGAATSASAAAIVAEAQRHLGFQEGPNNQQPFSEHFGVRNVPWCAYFVSYVHTKVGIPLSIGSTVAMLSELQRRGRFFTTAPSPGDIVVFDWTPGDGKPAEHVGIVESVARDASGQTVVTTIEGNSSNSVKRNKHALGSSKVVGYGRLWDAGGASSPGTGTTPSGGSAATGTAAALLAEARKHIGFREGPNNTQPFSAYFGRPNVAWCAYFVSYVHTKVGIPLNIGSTDLMLSELRRRGRFFTTVPSPGDIVIFDWHPGDSDPAEHAGLVESVTRGASGQVTVNTIEGNSNDVVARRSYPFGSSKIVGYGRLWASAGATSSPSGSTSGSSTSSGAAPCAHAKPTTTANPYVREFTDAAARVGVPSSWATDPALIQLVGHESGWKTGVKNPSSSAFGLFQFIRSTWQAHLPEVPYGTPDPMWQAVGGYRYIKAAYRTPDRAWAFWQATVCKNASLAPSDLQSRASTWISKGYAGY